MAIQLLPVILTAIRAGVPAAKLISKYGKKAYNIAKKKIGDAQKLSDKEQQKLFGKTLGGLVGTFAAVSGLTIAEDKAKGRKVFKWEKEKNNLRSSKDKKFKGHSSYKE